MTSRTTRDLFPPRETWDRAPHNRWSFQHIREILPTVEVWRGDGPISALPEAPQDLASLRFEENGATLTIGQWLAESFTDGFLVLHKGRRVTEQYFNAMGPRTLHLSQSMAKSITATAFGALMGKGLIDPTAPVTKYLPELEQTAWKGATLQHCLDMTSGVTYNEEYTLPDSDMAKTDVASGWKPMPQGVDWPTHIWAQILTLNATTRPHGQGFEYRSIETDIVAFAMQAATGQPLAEIISQEIWQKIGAQESACFTVDRAGYALADGGLNACLRDYARFAQLWVNDGHVNGTRILPQSWVDATHTGDASKFGAPYTEISPHGAYKNQFWLRDVNHRILMARGVFGQLIYIDPAHEFTAVKLSSWPEFTSPTRSKTALKAIEAIRAALT
jgi:CubicO group peptidase (beta-lactamase class C family)